MEQIDKLIEAFANLTLPPNFVKTFDGMDEFRAWCNDGTVEDLEHALTSFKEYEEVYEYCAIIFDVIKQKQKQK
ncbi:hypothetical protein N8Z10_01090 [bacterium]|nr:hypothetical protein [bacterium]